MLTAPLTALGVPLSSGAYLLGSVICHQRPERSFHTGGSQLPVCARCLGLYAGAAAGALAGLSLARRPSNATLRLVLIVAAVPTAITWTSEQAALWMPANSTRFLAALPLGLAAAVTVNYLGCAPRPRTDPRARPTHI
jgi:uncharacterized membrane protein